MKHTVKGFTLIEVLIALSILAIALTALMYSSMQASVNLQHLDKKTAANFVAQNVVALAHANQLAIPFMPDFTQGIANSGVYALTWHASKQPTDNPYTSKLTVTVFDENAAKQFELTAFMGETRATQDH